MGQHTLGLDGTPGLASTYGLGQHTLGLGQRPRLGQQPGLGLPNSWTNKG